MRLAISFPTRMAVVTAMTLTLSSCGTGVTASDGGATQPSIKITMPANNATVTYAMDHADVDVSFTVQGLTLKDVGKCAGAANCGRVQLFVDGTTCNDSSDPMHPKPFNEEVSMSPTTIGLDYCPGFPALAAMHTLTAQLFKDDETAVTGSDGKPVKDQINFMVKLVPNSSDGGAGDDGGTTNTVTVGQGGASFSPASLTIKVGDTVHWVWASGGHNVVSGTGAADDKFCSPSDTNCAAAPTSTAAATYDHRFTAAGSYPYFCRPHMAAGMKGTITVQ